MLTHATNAGKAAALRDGFRWALERGYTHALTIDTDGQHDIADVSPLIELARSNPNALILGSRSTPADRVHRAPWQSTVGRRISNHFVWLESGASVADSQCGLRVYPLHLESQLHSGTSRYGYETEILTRLAWAGANIVETPIRSIYDVPGGRTSHFRPIRDSIAASEMHAALVLRAVMPWPAKKLVEPASFNMKQGVIIERITRWMNPMRVWRDLRACKANRERFAAAMASGVALAALPPYGAKTITCLIWSKWWKLDSAVMVAASSLNTPPFGPLFAAAGITLGHAIRNGKVPAWSTYNLSQHTLRETLLTAGIDYLIGSLIIAPIAAAAVYLIVRQGLNALPFHHERSPDLSIT